MSISPFLRLKEIAPQEQPKSDEDFSVAWQSPANIAIIKYWGKKYGQLPASPSLSMTLDQAVTETHVNVFTKKRVKGIMAINGDPDHLFLPKMQRLYDWMAADLPVLNSISLSVSTRNTFPHSTGIASSASGISAFALCLLSIAGKIMSAEPSMDEFLHMASGCARIGSGSACRSMYGGFAVWGRSGCIEEAADEYATPVTGHIHPAMYSMRDAILVISADPKILSSTLGHESMQGHPFFSGRIGQSNKNLEEALQAMSANDFEKLSAVAECEALTLHALIMSANPGSLLMKPATVEVIHRVREARNKGIPLFFTLDAGANVHVMYPDASAAIVENFIRDVLQPLCEDNRVIFDRCGKGPVNITSIPGL
ncbi:MAG: hypothetical protein Q8M08_06840 [Bacteroidales bacterium]|nr:hypothetical protein [Bacteroidales bacterium]